MRTSSKTTHDVPRAHFLALFVSRTHAGARDISAHACEQLYGPRRHAGVICSVEAELRFRRAKTWAHILSITVAEDERKVEPHTNGTRRRGGGELVLVFNTLEEGSRGYRAPCRLQQREPIPCELLRA